MLPHKARLEELRHHATTERDLHRLRQSNAWVLQTIRVAIVVFLIAGVVLTITIATGARFASIIVESDNCQVTYYEARQYFDPICKHCRSGYNLSEGECFPVTNR